MVSTLSLISPLTRRTIKRNCNTLSTTFTGGYLKTSLLLIKCPWRISEWGKGQSQIRNYEKTTFRRVAFVTSESTDSPIEILINDLEKGRDSQNVTSLAICP
ncbi:hypothetical protein TNIN_34171 [Trichonephila inaurata madagascariensis]|uniref:Uncharacterized protein n=1 Tax=Trichonephila inaurata madagascariensis TaxID=2747483 RepID=A0A8X7BRP3_9ARAC|nr:hypothetical protein TNIN_34171 [Trichonephila inaurata madagascariensis]